MPQITQSTLPGFFQDADSVIIEKEIECPASGSVTIELSELTTLRTVYLNALTIRGTEDCVFELWLRIIRLDGSDFAIRVGAIETGAGAGTTYDIQEFVDTTGDDIEWRALRPRILPPRSFLEVKASNQTGTAFDVRVRGLALVQSANLPANLF